MDEDLRARLNEPTDPPVGSSAFMADDLVRQALASLRTPVPTPEPSTLLSYTALRQLLADAWAEGFEAASATAGLSGKSLNPYEYEQPISEPWGRRPRISPDHQRSHAIDPHA